MLKSKVNTFKDYFKPLVSKADFKIFAESFVLAGKLKKYLRKQKKNEDQIKLLLDENVGGCVPELQAQNVMRVKQLLRQRAKMKVE